MRLFKNAVKMMAWGLADLMRAIPKPKALKGFLSGYVPPDLNKPEDKPADKDR